MCSCQYPPINYCKAALCLPKSIPSRSPPHMTSQQSQLGHTDMLHRHATQTCHTHTPAAPQRQACDGQCLALWPLPESKFILCPRGAQTARFCPGPEGRMVKRQDKLGYTIKGYTHDLCQNPKCLCLGLLKPVQGVPSSGRFLQPLPSVSGSPCYNFLSPRAPSSDTHFPGLGAS